MDRGLDRALRRLEAGRHGGIAASRRLPEQARLELIELGGASSSCPVCAKVGEQVLDDRQRPAPLEERFRGRVILEFDQVLTFGVPERDHLPATAALLRPFTCRSVGQVVFQRRQKERAKPASILAQRIVREMIAARYLKNCKVSRCRTSFRRAERSPRPRSISSTGQKGQAVRRPAIRRRAWLS
jgi:hypothetical protein